MVRQWLAVAAVLVGSMIDLTPGRACASGRPTGRRPVFVPLTQIAQEVGTSVRMVEQHYAGVIANWDGKQVPAERSIRTARKTGGRKMDGTA